MACIQLASTTSIAENLKTIARAIERAKEEQVNCVFLPECCNLMQQDGAKAYEEARSEREGTEVAYLARLAQQHELWLQAGSLVFRDDSLRDDSLRDDSLRDDSSRDDSSRPESAAGKLVNRSLLFSPEGEIKARYDKIHLFDVDLDGGESYRESARYVAGKQAVLAALPWGGLGMSVCYDLRFPRLYRHLAEAGAIFLAVPAAFTVSTGRAHWKCLLRARAIENACFLFAAAQTGELADGRKCWGHSLIVSPWGDVLAEAGVEPEIITARIDIDLVRAARAKIPALSHEQPFLPFKKND